MGEITKEILIACSILILGSFLSLLTKRSAKSILGRISSRTLNKTDDFIVENLIKNIKPIGLLITIGLAWSSLPILAAFDKIVQGILKVILLVIIVRFINKVIHKLVEDQAQNINDEAIKSMLASIGPMIRAVVWCVGTIFYLQNLGVQMAAIWALLSAGGIGAGLALKEPVQEFFEYLTILLDKPFQKGQFINVEGVWATVERVGVRSTRLKSLNGEIIIMSNSKLTNGIISNYAEMKTRRIVHRLGVVYETPIYKMKEIPTIIEKIINNTENVKFDRCHFVGFGNSSLDIELVYFIPTNDYLKAMTAQQIINIEIMREFEERKIEFAFPTQTIHISKNTN